MADLRPSLRSRLEDGPLVLISKTNRETTIHRAGKMDYIGVKRVDGGRVVGELRLIGLFTSKTYAESARTILDGCGDILRDGLESRAEVTHE